MKRTLLYIVALLALVSCQKDPDVVLTMVEVSDEVFTPSYTTSIVQCNITSSNSRIDVSVLYSPSADMTNAQEVAMQKESGCYKATLTGLQDETTYYVRYKVSNKMSSLMAKQTNEFKTLTPSIPEVRLSSITNVLDSSAVAEISLVTDGGAEVSQYGVCWSTGEMPTKDDAHSETPKSQSSYSLSLLLPNTKYYVRAYAINKKGIAYSEAKSLLTYALPCVETKAITNIQKTGCQLNGEVTFDGNDANYVEGFCWGTKSQPTLSDNCTTMAESDAIFSHNLTNLKAETTYYVRAFAKNKIGLVYGNELTFTTQAPDKPTVTTSSVTNTSYTSVTCGGNVTDDGGASVTERGVCYSTTSNPTTSNSVVKSGSGTGSFTCSLTGLTAGTTYYVRAYAVNKKGTSYGTQQTFTTTAYTKPTITTSNVTNISYTGATCGGNVTSDGGQSVTERGICYATTSNPTISNSKITSGTGTGSFSCNISGLTDGKTYYVRAYATNSKGTSYGEIKSFTAIKPTSGTEVGHEWVELGLSVKWATMNVGATTVTGHGDYYAWGETSPKSFYGWNTYKFCNGSSTTITQYGVNGDNRTTLDGADDAAHVNWGGNWRMPTKAEQDELKSNCTVTWTTNYQGTGVAGRIFTSNRTGYTDKSIFLPNTGFYNGTELITAGLTCAYWSSSIYGSGSGYASILYFYEGYECNQYVSRYYGHSVRAVCP